MRIIKYLSEKIKEDIIKCNEQQADCLRIIGELNLATTQEIKELEEIQNLNKIELISLMVNELIEDYYYLAIQQLCNGNYPDKLYSKINKISKIQEDINNI